MNAGWEAVLDFWFDEAIGASGGTGAWVERWFGGGPSFDEAIRERFADLPERAAAGELSAWRESPKPAVALTIVLDQLPRNLYRGSARAFAFDGLAHALARDALERGFDRSVEPIEAMFFYLPLEHAEDPSAQARCVALFGALLSRCALEERAQFESFLSYAKRHLEVIDRFGRFPHRNEVLARQSTNEEAAYLASGGDTF